MMTNIVSVLLFLTCANVVCPTSGAKILLVPNTVNSHVIYFRRLGTELARLGHVTHMLLPSSIKIPTDDDTRLPNSTGNHDNVGSLETIVYPVGSGKPFIGSRAACENLLHVAMSRSIIEWFRFSIEFGIELNGQLERDCVQLLENRSIMDTVRSNGYDFAIMDAIASNCYFALPYSMGIPYETLSLAMSPLIYRVPRLPSFQFFTDVDLSTFRGRLTNFVFEMTGTTMARFLTTEYIEKYAPGKPVLDLTGLVQQASLYFYLEDITIGQPLPLMPNTVSVGDLMAGREGKPLPPALDEFVSRHALGSGSDIATNDIVTGNSGGGVVVVSFGSFFDYVPHDVIQKFCDTFRRLPAGLGVIWKLSNVTACGEKDNADSVRIQRWIPQNDLLADTRVRLFITHAGLNSIVESIYHAKPVVAFPIGLDQPYNARQIVTNEFGIRMNLADFNSDQFLAAIDEVLTNPKYRRNVEKASEIMRSRRYTPAQRVSDAIEHVVKFGDRHLRTTAFELNILQFIMFDIFAVIGAAFLGAFLTIYLVCWYATRWRCRRKKGTDKQKND